MIWIVLIVVVVVLLLVFGVVGFNRLRTADVGAQEALGGIDVQLTRRADLIPNLVETVKGYAAHEKGVFEEVTRARAGVQQAAAGDDVPAKAAADAQLQGERGLSRRAMLRGGGFAGMALLLAACSAPVPGATTSGRADQCRQTRRNQRADHGGTYRGRGHHRCSDRRCPACSLRNNLRRCVAADLCALHVGRQARSAEFWTWDQRRVPELSQGSAEGHPTGTRARWRGDFLCTGLLSAVHAAGSESRLAGDQQADRCHHQNGPRSTRRGAAEAVHPDGRRCAHRRAPFFARLECRVEPASVCGS